jgi:hypothetical protein
MNHVNEDSNINNFKNLCTKTQELKRWKKRKDHKRRAKQEFERKKLYLKDLQHANIPRTKAKARKFVKFKKQHDCKLRVAHDEEIFKNAITYLTANTHKLREWSFLDIFQWIFSLGIIKDNEYLKGNPQNYQELINLPKPVHLSYFPAEYTKNRRDWVEYVGHCVPTIEAILSIKYRLPGFCKGISVGCGVALWERLLQDDCFPLISIDAIDACPPKFTWMRVVAKSVSEVDWSVFYHLLIVIWPLPQTTYDYDALCHFKGNYVLYIGMHENDQGLAYKVGSFKFKKELKRKRYWELIFRRDLPGRINNYTRYRPVLYLYNRICSK